MAISFSDEQVKSMSNDVLNADKTIAQIKGDKEKAKAGKEQIKKKDEENAVFTDNFEAIISSYHAELVAIDGTNRSDYSHAEIEKGGRQQGDALHFEVVGNNKWPNLQPKVTAGNNGNPITHVAGQNELDKYNAYTPRYAILVGGFTDGSLVDTLAVDYVVGSKKVEVTLGGFAVGQRIAIDSGTFYLYATITEEKVGTLPAIQELTIETIIDSTVLIPTSTTIKNFWPAPTNAQREGTVGALLNAVKSWVKASIDDMIVPIDKQISALAKNDSTDDTAQINAAKTNTQTIKTAITTWQASPDSGVGVGKYGNTVIGNLNTALSTRSGQRTSRISEIGTALGSVSQTASDGKFTGTGQYGKLFKWLDMRLNLAGGSLTSYYSSAGGENVFDQQISQTQSKKDEFTKQMVVSKLKADADGSNVIVLESIKDIAVSNAVKICSDTQKVINATIISITGNSVKLSSTIPNAYVIGDTARLVKML